jgi:peptidylprolyl isomerase
MSRRRLLRTATLLALLAGTACDRKPPGNPDPAANTYSPTLGVALPAFTKTQSGLYYLDLQPGTGGEAQAGRKVTVHYTGWLPDGEKFDSSVDAGKPYVFTLGAGDVIKGWDEGIAGMKAGGRRKLVVPAPLGYGASGQGPIPANSVLVFDVELLGVQ